MQVPETMPAPAALLIQNPDGTENVALSDTSHSENGCSEASSPSLESTYEVSHFYEMLIWSLHIFRW